MGIRVAFIARSTLYKIHGGSGVQVVETAKHLRKLGAEVTIFLAHQKIPYEKFDLFHFFDITRPANMLYHISKLKKPFVVSTILVDYSVYDKQHRGGVAGFVFRLFPGDGNEYLKTIGRWILGKDSLRSKAYCWNGQKRSIKRVLKKAAAVLPNSRLEYDQLKMKYKMANRSFIVPNGIDPLLFYDNQEAKDPDLVICAARIEGIKNQLQLIRALNNSRFKLLLIGETTPGQQDYFETCKKIAASNIEFVGNITQQELAGYYRKAKLHVLPSWFETCGLSSLEAGAMGCNVVVSEKGFVRDYFGDDAFYCDPADPSSIYKAVEKAADCLPSIHLKEKIRNQFTWEQAAAHTMNAYKKILADQ